MKECKITKNKLPDSTTVRLGIAPGELAEMFNKVSREKIKIDRYFQETSTNPSSHLGHGQPLKSNATVVRPEKDLGDQCRELAKRYSSLRRKPYDKVPTGKGRNQLEKSGIETKLNNLDLKEKQQPELGLERLPRMNSDDFKKIEYLYEEDLKNYREARDKRIEDLTK